MPSIRKISVFIALYYLAGVILLNSGLDRMIRQKRPPFATGLHSSIPSFPAPPVDMLKLLSHPISRTLGWILCFAGSGLALRAIFSSRNETLAFLGLLAVATPYAFFGLWTWIGSLLP